MSCFHPNIVTYMPKGFRDSEGKLVRNSDGTIRQWRFLGSGYEEKLSDDSLVYRLNDGSFVEEFGDVYRDGEVEYSIPVPCQQCIGCRIDYSRHWADRIVMESLCHPEHTSFFLTLTYDEDHIVKNYTGEFFEYLHNGEYSTIRAATLVKKDVQDFMKRLREYYSRVYDHDGIRFYCAGEYGTMTRRPHYHICVFNLPIQDLKVYSRNFRGDILYNSPKLEELWGKGYVVIGELTWECAAYTARYVVKKFKGKEAADFYFEHGNVLPEFSLSSRRPGLAAQYFDEHKEEIYKYDRVQLPSSDSRNGSVSVPRYFDKMLERYQEDHPDDHSIERLEKIKAQRRELSELKRYNERILVGGAFDKEYFRLKKQGFSERVRALKRSLDI